MQKVLAADFAKMYQVPTQLATKPRKHLSSLVLPS